MELFGARLSNWSNRKTLFSLGNPIRKIAREMGIEGRRGPLTSTALRFGATYCASSFIATKRSVEFIDWRDVLEAICTLGGTAGAVCVWIIRQTSGFPTPSVEAPICDLFSISAPLASQALVSRYGYRSTQCSRCKRIPIAVAQGIEIFQILNKPIQQLGRKELISMKVRSQENASFFE
jgi:hypothetical protein